VSLGLLVQVILNVLFLSGLAVIWSRMRRSDGDDPRMSRSLQLLQSKIAILEDLSDRIDEQLAQASSLMEHKRKDLDLKLGEIDRTLSEVQASREKSLEVAKIFQDRIPHQEIIERQRTREYVKAATMSHQGASLEEIVEKVNLPPAEIELIAKINRDQLQFAADSLPDWAQGNEGKQDSMSGLAKSTFHEAMVETDGPIIEFPKSHLLGASGGDYAVAKGLESLGEKFRNVDMTPSTAAPAAAASAVARSTVAASAVARSTEAPSAGTAPVVPPVLVAKVSSIDASSEKIKTKPAEEPSFIGKTSSGKSVVVQKIVFPKIQVNQHLS